MTTRPLTGLMPRHAAFLLLTAATGAWFWKVLARVVSLSFEHGRYEHYSHIVLIPGIILYLLYVNRRVIFTGVRYAPWPGSILMAIGMGSSWSAGAHNSDPAMDLTQAMLSVVTACWGAFLLCYGFQACKRAVFELLLLLFMVPLPPLALQAVIAFLLKASAEATDLLFRALDVPVFRQGSIFMLPGLTIEIAEECSGIRSSLALLITSLLAGHLFLRSGWTKLALVAAVVPLTVFKNAVRIVVLSLLGAYVDRRFIADSIVHRNGGIPLFFGSLAVLALFVWLLRRWESGGERTQWGGGGQESAPPERAMSRT